MKVPSFGLCFLFFGFFVTPVCGKGASIRKSVRYNYQEDLHAEANSLIYKPQTYHYYQIQNQHHYPQQQQPYYQPV